jgi:Lrp/AsnC family transcriptional regulator, regulator for asnA, asnC and gidA
VSSLKLDRTNLTIIRELQEGRKSFQKIAEKLHLTENTIRNRVKKMQEAGVLEITGRVDPEAVPGGQLAIIGVKLDTMDLISKGEEFGRRRGVISVAVVTGRFDLLVTVLLQKQFGLLEFYTTEVNAIEEVQSVETFVVYKGYNLKVPYTYTAHAEGEADD